MVYYTAEQQTTMAQAIYIIYIWYILQSSRQPWPEQYMCRESVSHHNMPRVRRSDEDDENGTIYVSYSSFL